MATAGRDFSEAKQSQGVCTSLDIVDHTLDDARLERRCPLDQGRHPSRATTPAGLLDLLPVELLSVILLTLDVPSLTTFRRANCRAMTLVDSLPRYAMIREHCPNVLRAILSLGAVSFSLNTLFETLCTSKCACCHRFGSYLYLISCERVCYFCFTTDAAYMPMTATEVARGLEVPREQLQSLPCVLSLPGMYTGSGQVSRGSTLLFDRSAVLDMEQEPSERAVESGILQHKDRKTREPRRHMAIISAPYFVPSEKLVDWGYYCAGCRASRDPETHFRTKFTRRGMMEHVATHQLL